MGITPIQTRPEPPPIWTDGRKLNLGAGYDPTDAYVRVDWAGNPDIFCDVRWLPFQNQSFSEIRAYHILEHLPREDFIRLMNSCWVVLEDGGILDIEVPIFPSDDAMADPTHISFFVASTFDYFVMDKGHNEHRLLYEILPWKMIRRERMATNSILGVTLEKIHDPVC